MKKIGFVLAAAVVGLLVGWGLCSCSDGRPRALTATDLVLIYAGGTHSPRWDREMMSHYVTYTDREGRMHWLFDGFLLLEIRDIGPGSARVAFDPGHKDTDGTVLPAATQVDWLKLLRYYFSEGHGIAAIEEAVAAAAETLGAPATKRQVVISIPNPIVYKEPLAKRGGTSYWGMVEDRILDFSREEDRFLACKWYIDQALRMFEEQDYKYVELAGFYWVTEESEKASPLLADVSSYLDERQCELCWIPYFHAPGYTAWRERGFDRAFYQPNYFFSDDIPRERLAQACREAAANGLDMEMEFDESAMARCGRGSRLRDYMEAFRESGAWAGSRIAYYQSHQGLVVLKNSSVEEDVDLYHDFCTFVSQRPFRTLRAATEKL
ncbi:DUF4855 domain-containing protein [Alistipes sp.]|uniref:DUF4855 domain-containing protein n=1 Tax=Alistipes sp. TaxID=1872444 RepID=UPI0025C47D8D|nr:DUF4855 domain-containing protein [Alistipes sp.]